MDEAKLSDLSYLDDYINAEKNIASQTAEDEDFSDMKNYVLLVFGIAAIQNPIQMALTFQRVVYRNYEQEEIKKEGKRRYSRSVEYDPNYVAPTDYMGYLNDNEYDRQRFMVKVEKGDKTLSVLKSITNTLGIVGLWRGYITHSLRKIIFHFTQKFFESRLLTFFRADNMDWLTTNTFVPNLMTIALSNTVANFVTHPLFVVQTRLMVQSALRKEKRYFGFKTIGTIIQQEGISGFFKYPSFLLFYVSAMPILQFGPTILTRRFLSDKSISIQILALILLKLGALLILTPLETIYTRLSIQASPSIRTCVRISVIPYINAVNCLTRIIKEEGITTLYAGWRWNLVQVFLGSLKENIVLEIEE